MPTATTTWDRKQGDLVDYIDVQLDGISDLTGVVSGEAHLTACDSAVAITATVTVIDALNRIVRADLSTFLPTAIPGPWDVEWEMTFGNGSQWTWPSRGRDRLNVYAQAA
jgi:hypothetical protein